MLDKQEVLAYIRQNEFANTRQLCEHFQVSESTVRRLLDKLDAAGLVTRIHGGAMPVSDPNKMTEFQLRNRQNKAQKIAIAREAAKLIQGGGGGQPHFATAGGKDADGLSAAVDKLVALANI